MPKIIVSGLSKFVDGILSALKSVLGLIVDFTKAFEYFRSLHIIEQI